MTPDLQEYRVVARVQIYAPLPHTFLAANLAEAQAEVGDTNTHAMDLCSFLRDTIRAAGLLGDGGRTLRVSCTTVPERIGPEPVPGLEPKDEK